MEHGKTSQISIGRVLHFIGMNKNIRIKLVSCTDDKATEKTNAVKKIMEYSPDYKRIFPDTKKSTLGDSWTGHRLVVERDVIGMVDATLESQSIMAEGIGGRCDILMLDDVVDFQNSATEVQRAKIRDIANTVWMTRVDETLTKPFEGIVLYIGTAWHEDDLMHFWMGKGSPFCFLKMGVSDDFEAIDFEIINGDDIFLREDICFEGKEYYRGRVDGQVPLWEEKPKEILLGKFLSDEEGEGRRFFDRAYRNRFVSTDEQIFCTIHDCKDRNIDLEDIMNEDTWPTFMGVDLAISKRPGSAFTVFTIGKMSPQGKKYLVEVVRGRYSSPATAIIALGLGVMYNIEVGFIENNAYQQSILEWIEILKDDLGANQNYIMSDEEKEIEKAKMEIILEAKYTKNFSKDIKPELWAYIKPSLLLCGASLLSFRPYTTGRTLMDEKVGLPMFATEMESAQWIIPWKDHCEDVRMDFCGCDMCKAIKEMFGYPGAKYKDCVMSWFFLSRAMKSGGMRVRSLG